MKALLFIASLWLTLTSHAQVPAGYSTVYSKTFETTLKAGEYLKSDAWYFYSGSSNVRTFSHPELDKRFIIKNDPKNASNKTLEMIKYQGDVDYSNISLNPRTELSFRPSLERVASKEIYFQLKTYFPANQATLFSAEFIQFWLHGTTGTDSRIPLQIEVRNGNFGARLPRSPGFMTPFAGKKLSAYTEKWITWEVHAKFNRNNGYWKVYMDRELVFTYSGPTNYWPGDSGTWHPQFGIYSNNGGGGTMVAYFDDLIVAEKTNVPVTDCSGTPNGIASLDACGICSGGTTGITASTPTNWYADEDGDGKGNPSSSVLSCTKPSGYVADKSDLCPSDKNKTSPGNCGCGVNEVSCVNLLPVVNILSPVHGTSFLAPAKVDIQTSATDSDGSIAKVEFYNGGTLLATDFVFPYSYTWNNLLAGNYIINIKATDNKGASSSKAVSFVVHPSIIPSTVGINGSSCATAGSKLFYTLTPENNKVSSINYWSNSAAVVTKDASDATKFSVEFPGYLNGTSITFYAGVNYSVSPWYKEYTKVVNVGSCASRTSVLLSPQPTQSTTVISLEDNQPIHSVFIFNTIGELVYQSENLNSTSVELGDELAAGIYILQVWTENGATTARMLKK
ncbi:MAG: Ig-like domain-containing protein [Cytophagaceae bacterium]|nr:Ig-like domain-containing protein [Cytophagaceae bacterium]